MTHEQLRMLRRAAPFTAEAVALLFEHIDQQAIELAAHIEIGRGYLAERDAARAKVANLQDCIRGIRDLIAVEDFSRARLWANDALSGFTDSLEATTLQLSDTIDARDTEIARLKDEVAQSDDAYVLCQKNKRTCKENWKVAEKNSAALRDEIARLRELCNEAMAISHPESAINGLMRAALEENRNG